MLKLPFSGLLLLVGLSAVASIGFDLGYDRGSNSAEDCEPEPSHPYCSKHWHLFVRKPSAANSNTKYWCLRVFMDVNGTNQPDASSACKSVGAVLSTVAGEYEHTYVLKKARRFFDYNNITQGAIWVDGSRVQTCRTFNDTIRQSPLCSNSATVFEMEDDNTDPAYIFTQWAAGSPSWSYWPLREDKFVTYPTSESITANCMNMMVNPSSENLNGRTTDMHCSMVVPPYSYRTQQLTNYGRVCGRIAKYK